MTLLMRTDYFERYRALTRLPVIVAEQGFCPTFYSALLWWLELFTIVHPNGSLTLFVSLM
jgi:hypothetical protein